MADLWLPGAEKRPEGNGGSMAGGPPRAIWHITWDELGKGGKLPAFDNIATYLKNVDFCPHLMWDPWSGRVVQFYPANQSARAARNLGGGVETNRMGSRCIQVEVWFSPGAVVGGKKYATVADTPCKNLDKIVAWMRSHGIPDEWPMGWPKWSGNFRSTTTWRTEPGHYGHCHVPENDHTDPGPMPRDMFTGGSPKPPASTPVKAPNGTPVLQRGSSGARVGQLQAALNKAIGAKLKVDDDFGANTEDAVRDLQRKAKIGVDGRYGEDSEAALRRLLT